MENEIMVQCDRFKQCNAPLCPLDNDLDKRVWYSGDDVCVSRKYGKHRWIKKQRGINMKQYKCWIDKPVTYEMLYNASRPPKPLTEEQIIARNDRLAKGRANSPLFKHLT